MSLLRPAARDGRQFLNPIPTALGGLGLMLRLLPEYLTSKQERVPRAPIGPFHTDPALYAVPPASGLRVTWFGHSSLLLEINSIHILIDPVWDERASPSRFFGPRRFFPPTIPLADLPRLDAILLSHDHYDHLGEQTVRKLAALRPETRWITSLKVGQILSSFGVAANQITELDWSTDTTVAAPSGETCRITSVPARHFSGRSLHNRFQTLWASFVLRGPSHTVYYGADTGPWPGFAEIGQTYGPFDLTLLEIGAYNRLWGNIHLGPDGAVQAFRDLGATGLLMPIHWALFDLALHAWRDPIQRFEELATAGALPVFSPTPGRPTEVQPITPLFSRWWTERR